jgi:multidrug resistance efflux pump
LALRSRPGDDLLVDVGHACQGDVIARLDTSVLDAEVAKAEAGLALAQANLDQVKAGARRADPRSPQRSIGYASGGDASLGQPR